MFKLKDFGAGDDWEVAHKPENVSSEWLRTIKVEDRPKFKATLLAQQELFGVLSGLLESKYRKAHRKEFDLTQPNVKDNMMYHEGYKRALSDIRKLLPLT